MKVLCLVGPTATGKTKLAVSLSTQYQATLISADSRQLYRQLDIVTGKDHPQDITLHGIDLVAPDEDFSVSNWYKAILPYISSTKLAIVVGGTALYVKTLLAPPQTLNIPIDHKLRLNLSDMTVAELQSKLLALDQAKFAAMNPSDSHNPRRLTRAIEVTSYRGEPVDVPHSRLANSLVIGLSPPQDANTYLKNIHSRVLSRLKLGAVAETQRLLANYPPTLPALTAIGYRSIAAYLGGKINQDEMITTWTNDEYSYAKRQLLFLKSIKDIIWIDADSVNIQSGVENIVKTWYDSKHKE